MERGKVIDSTLLVSEASRRFTRSLSLSIHSAGHRMGQVAAASPYHSSTLLCPMKSTMESIQGWREHFEPRSARAI